MTRLNDRRSITGPYAREVLETPATVGYRPGMSSCTVIGRKLCSVYAPPSDRKREIESALETLGGKLS